MVVRLYLRSPYKQLYLRRSVEAPEVVDYYDRIALWHKKYPPSCSFTLSHLLELFSLSLAQVGADALLVERTVLHRNVPQRARGPYVADWLIVSHGDPEANEPCGLSCSSSCNSSRSCLSVSDDSPDHGLGLDESQPVLRPDQSQTGLWTTENEDLFRDKGSPDAARSLEAEGLRGDSQVDKLLTREEGSSSSGSSSRRSARSDEELDSRGLLRPLPSPLTECIRLPWDSYFIKLAEYTSKRSNCRKRRVGALLVRERRIISTGYNGTSFTSENCLDGGCTRCQQPVIRAGQMLDRCECIHAEVNALLGVQRELAQGSSMFVNLMPCFSCAKLIVQMGICRVVYIDDYDGDDAAQYMKKHRVIVSKHGIRE
ncbi:deoxycytidylate deaminase [Gregarina niphandrodes]|uniref:dCMP deaminase n=1 Tax=Gregarina niphandrodes TaxID=110365 RepID=A0A023B7U9_GRENI|nr:deoxycytidylate deaminase [Gregarina niphandrodes]EZG67892.1 deoxycytidylate deaminase [Gregarina niphandrodes]|eukprot:XP_011130140.1 deoxycytidylate deaminase [Gregarina niphandrodes]